ncbi:MAG TPA: hypothetical protein PK511_11740 [Chitinophagales bacterium]|nr:hypothetical protein [Cyclobacteriaceae bacterium]HMY34610.1 hypothetical protein [bacterium]HNI55187.1 hypothetical protein [Chitinophagales bacterium]HMY95689.1 hypothetical protein [Cyclobacteriaceae bacterium]HNA14619.1 hypothetical protein [Cyclobacteriaceae bacterium]
MECLRDFVGIEGCDAPEPLSGFTVNDLPGITSFMVGKIASNEQVTYLGAWNDIQERALKKFTSAIISAFHNDKKQRIKSVTQTVNLGRRIDAASVMAASSQYRGVTIELAANGQSAMLQSSLQVIYIQQVSIYATQVYSDFEIKVYDLDSDTVIDTITSDLVEGWNIVRVATAYDATRIFICYDAADFDSVELLIDRTVASDCQMCADAVYGYGNCKAAIYGAASASLSDMTIDKADNTYGLSPVFSIQCRYDWVVCNNIDLFTLAWQYCLGAEVMTERIYSDRQNRYTGIDLEKAKALRDEFQKGFEVELKNAISGIDIDESDCCIECVSVIQKNYSIP